MTIRRVLIANRGEIAVRIIRACREASIESVAVYSDADRDAVHVRAADRAVRIGPASPAESYLSILALIQAARSAEADAVHPGYGFLSERAPFARACADAGLIFVGPPAAVIERMGSKIGARQTMEAAGVPVVPGGTPVDQTDAGVLATAGRVGYPVLIKASAGGGGKGMRIVDDEHQAREQVPAARRESLGAFGDGTLYVERVIPRPRHVEVQVFADAHGHVVHLFERECSIQRRHQKVLEESPSPLTPAVRARICEAAVAAARASGYLNAGTVEFLVEGDGDDARFYFLEMNTRLQVEHPVTESVTAVDVVRAQLAVAAGEPLPWTQGGITTRGHAIECRVYAEDPDRDFLPQAGPLLIYREPSGPGIRVDAGVEEGGAVGLEYDPLLAKVIASAETRGRAMARMRVALRAFAVLGVRTNIPFLLRLLELPAFVGGQVHTGFINEHPALLAGCREPSFPALAAAAVVGSRGPAVRGPARAPGPPDPWSLPTGWGR